MQTQLAYILFKSLLLEYGASNVPTSECAKERHTDLPPEWLTTQGTGLREKLLHFRVPQGYCVSDPNPISCWFGVFLFFFSFLDRVSVVQAGL